MSEKLEFDGSPAKSTIDFLSHLRLVHFSLLAACLALLVAASTAPPYVMQYAYRQSQDIRIHVGDPRGWILDSLSFNKQIEDIFRIYPIFFTDGQIVFRFDQAFIPYIRPGSTLPGSSDWINAIEEFRDRYGEPDTSFETLEDFGGLWDLLYELHDVPTIKGWTTAQARLDIDPEFEDTVRIAEPDTTPSRVRDVFVHASKASVTYSGKRGWELVVDFLPTYQGQSQPLRTLHLPVQISRRNYQHDLAQRLGVRWPRGKFSESFKDLSRFSTEIRSLNFLDLENHLQRLGSEVGPPMQLFGVTVPVRSFRLIGPLILVAIQFYLFIHLRRRRWISLDPVAADQFPWIGVYTDRISRSVFILSLSALPISASTVIGMHGGFDIAALPNLGGKLVWALVGASFVTAFASCLEVSPRTRESINGLFERSKGELNRLIIRFGRSNRGG